VNQVADLYGVDRVFCDGVCEMWRTIVDITDRLTPDEKSSLEVLDRGPIRPSIPFQDAERLLGMGLVELSLGRLDLTIAGRQMLGMMRGA